MTNWMPFFFTPMLFMLLLVWLEAIRWFANCDKINTTNNNNCRFRDTQTVTWIKDTVNNHLIHTFHPSYTVHHKHHTIYAAIFDHHTWSQMMYVITISPFVSGIITAGTINSMILYYIRAYNVNLKQYLTRLPTNIQTTVNEHVISLWIPK